VRRLTPLLAALLALAVLSLAPASANAKVLWLCKPGQRANPCEPSLTTTLFSPSGQRIGVEHTRRPARPKADCFYVYPTVSDQQRPQATKVVDDVLRSFTITPSPDATWGTHLADGSIALGTLVDLVRRQIEIWGEQQQ
jgi:hypothetical protein